MATRKVFYHCTCPCMLEYIKQEAKFINVIFLSPNLRKITLNIFGFLFNVFLACKDTCNARKPSLLPLSNTPSQRGRYLVAIPTCLWTSQNCVSKVPSWKCLPPTHLSECTPTEWFLSVYNLSGSGTKCLCVCSSHGTLDFQIAWCHSDCHNELL